MEHDSASLPLRGLERDRTSLEREEKKLEMEIKKAAKQGNKQAATVLAKQLVALRKQKTRSYAASSQVQSVGIQAKTMQSTVKMAGAMERTSKTMGAVNKQMNPQKMAKTMQDFSRENAKMEMTDEMISDTLDDIFDESGDEEEQDAIVTQVLDEIGIEMSGKLAEAPAAGRGKIGAAASNVPTDDEIERQLAQLRT
ncbi:CHMP2B [Branchiostoma lanceolatum]|uniref:CHMP2B protein n=1 Tax=Branchiostoma lanceolatum TaxID=7740 RepID=A0A8K0EJP8_BRALA|nr:CHMP2B [Branchiostoma lanceolatum]